MKIYSYILFLFLSISSTLGQGSLKVGGLAPEITLKNEDGETITLSESKGTLTVVHFWASWSKPCKEKNRFLAQVYSKNKKEGFEIFSISIDKKQKNWLTAIKKQNLNWKYHTNDFKGMVYSKPAKDYKIYEVPTLFLLDEKGEILMINPSEKELEEKLKSLDEYIRLLPKKTTKYIYLTKRNDYLIYDRNDTLVLGGKGNKVDVSTLDTGKYSVKTTNKTFFFEKTNSEIVYDFQITYKEKQITLSKICNYEIRNKNGNLILKGNSQIIDYSGLKLKHKTNFYLILPNNAHQITLY